MKTNLAVFSFVLLTVPSSAMASANVLQDGTFQNAIGTGSNLTPWSDWTNAGVARYAAPTGIPGNYASLSWGADLFQRFSAPAPGIYTLSFYVQNPMPYATKMIIDLQQPLGGGWHLLDKVIDLPAATDFIFQSFTVNWTRTLGEPSEFYFSNSYNFPDPARGFQGTINPRGTFLNVADVKFALKRQTPAVPEPSSWAMLVLGFGIVGFSMRQRKERLLTAAVC